MFSVIREWSKGSWWAIDSRSCAQSFAKAFRSCFTQAEQLGVIWTAGALALAAAGYLVHTVRPPGSDLIFGVLALLAMLFAGTSVFLWPVMVDFDARPTVILRNAFLLSLARLPTTIACLVIVVGVGVVVVSAPAMTLISGSVSALVIYRLCHRALVASVRKRTDGEAVLEGGSREERIPRANSRGL
jgi:uncharacterized membrane protein YesL